MKLVILGKAVNDYDKKENEEVWTVGTHIYDKADKYFEFHHLPINHDGEKITEVPDFLRNHCLPLNNSICIMLALACEKYNFEEITIIGSPMNTKKEYIDQRSALAYVAGYYTGKGKKVNWIDLPKNNNYGIDKK